MGISGKTTAEFEQYIIDNLDTALKEEWIKAYHQPLIRAASGKVSDEEAFAKWEDTKYGTFSASEFVPILERKKLTYKLDLYMVERVLKKIKSQGEHGLYMVPESINIAKTDFDCCDMVTEIAKRIVDFLSGSVYAINGDLQKLGNGIFLCTPNNVPVEGKISDEQKAKKEEKKEDDKGFDW